MSAEEVGLKKCTAWSCRRGAQELSKSRKRGRKCIMFHATTLSIGGVLFPGRPIRRRAPIAQFTTTRFPLPRSSLVPSASSFPKTRWRSFVVDGRPPVPRKHTLLVYATRYLPYQYKRSAVVWPSNSIDHHLCTAVYRKLNIAAKSFDFVRRPGSTRGWSRRSWLQEELCTTRIAGAGDTMYPRNRVYCATINRHQIFPYAILRM